MKILTLGIDNSILDKRSPLAKRVLEYGKLVNRYDIIIPFRNEKEIKFSKEIRIFSSGGKNKIAQLFKVYKLAKKLTLKNKYEVISVQDQYYLALAGWLIAKKFKIGLEIQVHGFEKFRGLRKFISKFVIPRANSIRVVSQRLKKKLVNEFKVDENKIIVVPIFVDKEKYLHNHSIEKAKDANFIFLTVSRLVKIKNITMQIKALSEIVKKNKNIELWIAGDGEERKNLEEISKNLKVEDYVKFLGWIDDVDNIYRQSHAFVLSSDFEGWGMVVIEAAGYGLPILMTNVGCAEEVIKNGESGLVIKPGDKEELKNAMLELINNEELRKKLGYGAKEAVKNLLNKQKTLNLYKTSWEKALKK